MNAIKNWKTKTTVSFSIVAIIVLAMTAPIATAVPMPVPVKGVVQYANETMVPDGWTVSLENLNETYPEEPWTTTTNSSLAPLNYFLTGTAESSSTFVITASDSTGTFTGSETFTADPLETKIVNITIGILSVTVEYPNGGEEIAVGDVVEVSASASDDTEVVSVSFSYSADNGSTWNAIGAGSMVSGTVKDGIWNVSWNTAGLSLGNEYLIKAVATDNEGNTVEDTSDSTFSIVDKGLPLITNGKAEPSTILVNETTEVTFYVHAADKESEIDVVKILIPAEPPAMPEWKNMSCTGNYTSDGLIWGIYEYKMNLTPAFEDTYNFSVQVYDIYGNLNATIVSVKAVSWMTYNITVFAGWNLISLPLEPLDESISAVVTNPTPGDMIFGDKPGPGISWKFATYIEGIGWYGDLTELVPKEGYLYYAGANFTIPVTGNPVIDTNTTVYNSWNLLGYAKMENMTLSDAINEPYSGDMIFGDKPGPGISWKFATYIEGIGWYGDLTELIRGEGYLYYRNGDTFYWIY